MRTIVIFKKIEAVITAKIKIKQIVTSSKTEKRTKIVKTIITKK